jgi:hypothetical protein
VVHVAALMCHQGHSTAVGAGVLFTVMTVGAVHLLTLLALTQRKQARQAQAHPGFVAQVSRA